MSEFFYSFEQARKAAINLKIKSVKEYRECVTKKTKDKSSLNIDARKTRK